MCTPEGPSLDSAVILRAQQSTRGPFTALLSPSFQTPSPRFANDRSVFHISMLLGNGLWLFSLIIIVFRFTHLVTCATGSFIRGVGCYSVVRRCGSCLLSSC